MNLKQILTYSPLIGAFIVFLGALKLDIIYSNFGFNIFNYLDFSEILTSFLKDINIILFCVLLMIFHSIFGTQVATSLIKNRVNKIREKQVDGNIIRRRLLIKASQSGSILIGIIFSSAGYVLLFTFKKTWILYLTILFTLQVFIYLLDSLNSRLVTKFSDNAYVFIMSVIASFLFTLSLAGLEISKIKANQHKVTISTVDSTIVTNSMNIFVGKTDKYIFLHKIIEKSNTIIPTSQIKSLVIENNKIK